MSFTISYTGETTEYRVAAPTSENKEEEFYKRMNELSSNKKLDEEEILNLMVQECEEVFEDDDAIYCFGDIDCGDGYEEFNGYGKIEVEGVRGKIGGSEWRKEAEEHKSEFRDLHNKLREKDWFVEYYVQWKSVWEVEIDEDEFDIEKLHWKDSKVWYGDIPIDEDVAGKRPIAEEKTLYWKRYEANF